MAMKQLENLSPPIMRQVLPLVEQLSPLYTDLVNGREDFAPKPEETRRLVCYLLYLYLFCYTLFNLWIQNLQLLYFHFILVVFSEVCEDGFSSQHICGFCNIIWVWM